MVAKDVNAYIAAAPKAARARLVELRALIRTASPNAEEYISYAMPFYKLRGARVGFAAFTKHIALFGVASVVENFERELAPFKTTAKGAIHFPLDRPLPAALIKNLVKARMRNRDSRAAS